MTLPAPLADADARHTVTRTLDRNLFVEAGAGSGKTSSLVRRIVNLVASGVPVSQVAAITFTEAAATELRHRIRDALEEEGLARSDLVLVRAAEQVERAPITTLHGFALRLLSDHPVEAGLPPGFGVIDEITSVLAFDQSWRHFISQVGDDLDLLELQERAAVLGVGLSRFVDVARRFDANWDLLAGVGDPPPLSPLDLEPAVAAIADLGALTTHCIDDRDKLATALSELAAAAQAQRGADPLDQLTWLDGEVPWPGRRAGRKGNWRRMEVDEVRRLVAQAREEAEAVVDGYRQEVIAQFLTRVTAMVEAQVHDRRERGELAFHDLLVMARQLLRTQPAVREELHQRYRYLLLDEFQDTDPIQIELAVLLAADGEVGDRPWPELAPELAPGRMVVVGDPKQSIYRFRRADIGVYAQAEQSLVEAPTRLVSNFRSVPGIVDVVNQFFGRVMGEGDRGAQPAYAELTAVRSPDPDREEPPVVTLGGPHDPSTPVGEIREAEAADVAAVICRAMDEGWRTERDGAWLPVRLSDIAVLIPSRLSLPALEAAFSAANLPFRPETSSLVYATQEVREVMAGVRAIVNPASSLDVVAALRSNLFAVGDDQLLAWFQAGGSWDYRHIDPEAADVAPAVAEAFAVLGSWHRDWWWTDPSAMVDRIVTDRRLREAALAEPRPRDRWRRYRFLAEQARELTAATGGDLADFVAWVEIQSSDLARITEPVPAEHDDDAVRILTIHGSKGLEFPMVVVAGAPTQEVNRAVGSRVLFPGHGPPEVNLGQGKTSAQFDLHASVEEVLDGYERIRLHYVAATRARDLLVLSAHHKQGRASAGARTWDTLAHCSGWQPFEAQGDERYQIEAPIQLRLAAGTYPEARAVWAEEQARILARPDQVRPYSATALAERLAPALSETEVSPPSTDQSVVGPGGRPDLRPDPIDADGIGAEAGLGEAGPVGGAAMGLAVHGVLQHLDFADPAGIDNLVARHAEREGVADQADQVMVMVEAALDTPTIALARRHRHWRELYVAAPVGEHVVEGFVDLCIEGPDGLVVVDYKTDLITAPGALEAKVARYQHQAATYALLLERVTGTRPVECRFLFLNGAVAVEHTVDDLGRLIDAIEVELGEPALVS